MELAYCPDCKKQIQKRNSVILYLSSKHAFGKQKRVRLDKCMRPDIQYLNSNGRRTIACCCGHGIYPMTIICKNKNGRIYELLSNITIKRKRYFYRLDSNGFYYIPEVKNGIIQGDVPKKEGRIETITK